MVNKLLFLTFLSCISFLGAQQNEEFMSAKKYFDYQRFMLNREFKSKFDKEKELPVKIAIKQDFAEFMVKLDSIQNTAFIGTLIKVKNREDLSKIFTKNLPKLQLDAVKKSEVTEDAQYPGGFEKLRKEVADLFYSDAVLVNQKLLKANVVFVVEKDGSISFVKAEGDNFSFNRQAEIAVYLLPQKFSPAKIAGNSVRYRFKLPVAMSFE